MRFSRALKVKSQRRNTIAFDIDGTIAEYESGNYQEGVWGNTLPNTVEAMKVLKDRGFEILLFTSRNAQKDQETIHKWLEDNNLHDIVDKIEFGKPHYICLIDDRNIEFNNQSVEELVEQAENFKPWWDNGN